MDPTRHYQMMGHLLKRARAGCAKQEETENCRNWLLVETRVKLSETIGSVEELSTWHDEWTMTGEERSRRRRRGKQCATNNTMNTDWSHSGDCLKEPTTAKNDGMTNLASDGTHASEDLARPLG